MSDYRAAYDRFERDVLSAHDDLRREIEGDLDNLDAEIEGELDDLGARVRSGRPVPASAASMARFEQAHQQEQKTPEAAARLRLPLFRIPLFPRRSRKPAAAGPLTGLPPEAGAGTETASPAAVPASPDAIITITSDPVPEPGPEPPDEPEAAGDDGPATAEPLAGPAGTDAPPAVKAAARPLPKRQPKQRPDAT